VAKVNLCIDGNFILHKCVFILKTNRSINNDLKDMLNNDLNRMIKCFPFDNIYFCSDSRSWRKEIYKEYKGKRTPDNSINWENVYKIYDDFKNSLKSIKKIKHLQKEGIESDDFIAHIVNSSNKQGDSNLIMSSDRDLNQLVKYNLDKNYINVQWNFKIHDERFYLPTNYQIFLNNQLNGKDYDIFNLDDSKDFTEFIEKMVNKSIVIEVDSEESLFCKTITGDNTDNIITVIKLKDGIINEKDGRGIGDTGAVTIYNYYKEVYPEPIVFDDVFVDRLSDVILYSKKVKTDRESVKEIVKNNINNNLRLVELDTKHMPSHIFESMNNVYNDLNNRTIVNEVVNLEEKLENEGYFSVIKKDIPEEFRQKKTEDKFEEDSFWEL